MKQSAVVAAVSPTASWRRHPYADLNAGDWPHRPDHTGRSVSLSSSIPRATFGIRRVYISRKSRKVAPPHFTSGSLSAPDRRPGNDDILTIDIAFDNLQP
ncbi:hypothetical protein BJA5080_06494 [Bradyrhizobium diazoefficiens SEMIA 5080]|uniref:Uncharacterized protein n=1 Tax=Bradyrhizobium diazoefficiens SEMIA 5080 TaxID=754504 RepID=A0A837CQF9_9BRAD|nr:hypothetical protein BJA5080_06494 [Bradyrhizobium diazoefficiens SEMIA 5080]